MNYETVALIISVSILIIFVLYTIIYNVHLTHQLQKDQQPEIIFEERATETLEDHFKEEEMLQIREQIAAINELSETSEAKTAEGPLKIQKDEKILLAEGEKMYDELQLDLKSAMPETEAQKLEDLDNLKETLSQLEHLDPEAFPTVQDKQMDMGKGMLYDSISRKLQKIIKENNWDEKLFLQAEKLETKAFNDIKHLEHDDFIDTLGVMQEIGTISNLIEIDPYTLLLVFEKEDLAFEASEKVIISLVAENPDITLEQIKDITKWSGNYLNDTLDAIDQKGILKRDGNHIEIDGLINLEERRALQQRLISVEQKKVKKEQEIKEIQEERKAKEKAIKKQKTEELEEKQETSIEAAKAATKREITHTKTTKRKEKKAKKPSQPEKDKSENKIQKEGIPKPKEPPLPETPTDSPTESPMEASPKDDIHDLEEMVKKVEEMENQHPITPSDIESDTFEEYQDQIMAVQGIFNDVKEMTGGIIILQGLLWYLNQGDYPDMSKAELLEIVDIMKDHQLIKEDMTVSGVNLLIFEDIPVDADMKKLLKQFVIYGQMDVEDIQTALEWDTKKINQQLHKIWDLQLMRMTEDEKYYIPGLFNTQ